MKKGRVAQWRRRAFVTETAASLCKFLGMKCGWFCMFQTGIAFCRHDWHKVMNKYESWGDIPLFPAVMSVMAVPTEISHLRRAWMSLIPPCVKCANANAKKAEVEKLQILTRT